MAQSDITIDALDKVGKEDAEYLVSLVRSVPGFPKEGIIFRDFMPVLADAKGLRILLNALEQALPVPPSEFDSIAGLESRGFLFGPAMAAHLGKGFIAVRKAGKLPPETIGESYDLEYGTASVEIETTAVSKGERVLIVDDLIATGGTAKAATDLIEKAGGICLDEAFGKQSIENLIKLNPDVIVVINRTDSPAQEKIDSLKANPSLASVPAVANDRFVSLDYVDFYGGNYETIDTIEHLAQGFYPDLFQ